MRRGRFGPPQPEFIERQFDGHVIRQRTSDGYLDATAMCKACGKMPFDWQRLQSTTEYLEALRIATGIPVTQLVVATNEIGHKMQGTWIHPRAAMRLAQWCSPKFAILVDGWVLDLVEGRTH